MFEGHWYTVLASVRGTVGIRLSSHCYLVSQCQCDSLEKLIFWTIPSRNRQPRCLCWRAILKLLFRKVTFSKLWSMQRWNHYYLESWVGVHNSRQHLFSMVAHRKRRYESETNMTFHHRRKAGCPYSGSALQCLLSGGYSLVVYLLENLFLPPLAILIQAILFTRSPDLAWSQPDSDISGTEILPCFLLQIKSACRKERT